MPALLPRRARRALRRRRRGRGRVPRAARAARPSGDDADDVGGVASRDAGDGRRARQRRPPGCPTLDACRADRRWIDVATYFARGGMANLQTKRGCHYKCTFCAYPVIEGRGMRTRDPEAIAAEVATLLDEHGVDQFFIVDSVFNAPARLGRARVRGAATARAAHPLVVLRRARQLHGRAARPDARRGMPVGRLRHRRRRRRPRCARFRKSFNVDDILAASALCRERGLPFCHSLVFGGEGETWDTVAETDRRDGRLPSDGGDGDVRRARLPGDAARARRCSRAATCRPPRRCTSPASTSPRRSATGSPRSSPTPRGRAATGSSRARKVNDEEALRARCSAGAA